MHFKMIFIAVLIAFASNCLAQNITTISPNAQTIHSAFLSFTNDPNLVNITHQTNAIHKELQQIEKVFEMQIALRNVSQLNAVLSQVKTTRQQTRHVLDQIQFAIAHAPIRSFLTRIYQELLRILIEKYGRALKWIGLEILGELLSVSKFDNYHYSETVAIAHQLLATRFNDAILVAAYEADLILIEQANSMDTLGGKVPQAAKAKIDRYLQDFLKNCTKEKSQFTKVYYEELEIARLDNGQLNLLQRLESEVMIDSLNFDVHFVTKYKQLFLRIVE